MSFVSQDEAEEIKSNLFNWLVDVEPVEDGQVRAGNGWIMFYDAASDQFVPCAVPYDGAPDPWGKKGDFRELPEPSGHDWVSAVTIAIDPMTKTEFVREEFKQWSWQMTTDGWNEADALGLPGLYTIEQDWDRNNYVCDSCHIYTTKMSNECEHCGTSRLVLA